MIAQSLTKELQEEAQATRRLLERVPSDRLSWRPHARSMSLGQLAHHLATLPGGVARMAEKSEASIPDFELPEAGSVDEVLAGLDASVAEACSVLESMSDASMAETWRMVEDGRELMAVPRARMLRAALFSHWIHHRGQLTVYLRLLDVPVLPTYGPTADENPFAH